MKKYTIKEFPRFVLRRKPGIDYLDVKSLVMDDIDLTDVANSVKYEIFSDELSQVTITLVAEMVIEYVEEEAE